MSGNFEANAQALLARGVVIPCPQAVEIADDVVPERIARGVVIHVGSRISGALTSIGPGCEIGAEAPATLEDCQLGRGVALKGGYASGAVFLDGAAMGSGAHIRPGTILEEGASGAHTVGLKQTILMPFVTAGSLINFCDALMAGGTSRQDHSEIGSSYIHFNFTPHQDKATPSLIGDVPRGVMLSNAPIFLGGQGGLVGPARIAYGTVIPAGLVCRKDVLDENRLYMPPPVSGGNRPFVPGIYGSIDRIVANNLAYIGNLRALERWYEQVRKPAMAADEFEKAACEGAIRQIGAMLDERIKRLNELADRMVRSLELGRSAVGDIPARAAEQQQAFIARWPSIEAHLRTRPADGLGVADRDAFLPAWEKARAGKSYIEAIGSIPPEAGQKGSAWLSAVVDSVTAIWTASPRLANE